MTHSNVSTVEYLFGNYHGPECEVLNLAIFPPKWTPVSRETALAWGADFGLLDVKQAIEFVEANPGFRQVFRGMGQILCVRWRQP